MDDSRHCQLDGEGESKVHAVQVSLLVVVVSGCRLRMTAAHCPTKLLLFLYLGYGAGMVHHRLLGGAL